MTLLRHAVLLLVATTVSWWLFLFAPSDQPPSTAQPQQELPIMITPQLQPATDDGPESAVATTPPPAEPAQPEQPAQTTPPPPELGAPDGEEDPSEVSTVENLMANEELLEQARAELTGTERKGFATVLLASPEDQVEIAQFFKEEVVLVPRTSLDDTRADSVYFRLRIVGAPTIEKLRGRPALKRYRQYRDLFDYDYSRLPQPLRALRRSVLLRSEVYLFAALIPPVEWAAIIGRRGEALVKSGRDPDQVRRFEMRYVRDSRGGYDFRVEKIVFADDTQFRPAESRGE